MCLIKRKTTLISIVCLFVFLAALAGCGVRQSNTGSLAGRIVDIDGNVVVNAVVYSVFEPDLKVYSALDGSFYLGELPAGNNTIMISHDDFIAEERQIEVLANTATEVENIILDRTASTRKISNILVAEVASESVRITWNTYKDAACNIEYGTTSAYGAIYRETRASTEHGVILTGLVPATVYHFRVQYIDETGTTYYSYDFPFKTDEPDAPNAPASAALQSLTTHGVVALDWTAPSVGDAAGYNVYRSINHGDWVRLNDNVLGKNIRTYADNGAVPGTFSQYAVTAVNEYNAESVRTLSEILFVPGTANRDIVITLEDSPVTLYSDIAVSAGYSFTAEAGCEFLIDEKDALKAGLDEDRIEITVNGTMTLSGTAENPIVFGPLTGSGRQDHWSGIRVYSNLTGISRFENVCIFGCDGYAIEASADNVVMENIRVTYSESGILLKNVRNETVVSNCVFKEISNTGIGVENSGSIAIEDCSFTGTEYAVKSDTTDANDLLSIVRTDLYVNKCAISGIFGKLQAAENLIVCDNGTGISLDNVLTYQDSYIDHCTIDAYNGINIASGVIAVENNIVVNRDEAGGIGIQNGNQTAPSYSYNDVFGFTTLYSGCSAGTQGLSVDPLFIGGNPYSYELSISSVLFLQDKYSTELGRYGTSRM